MIELSAVDGGYRLVVSDRGPGFPDRGRIRLLERFARGEEGSPGAGLGLAIVKQAAEAHQGHVRLEDRPGGGASVLLYLVAAA